MHEKQDTIITKLLRRNIQQKIKEGRKNLPNNNNIKNKSYVDDDDALSKPNMHLQMHVVV